MPSVNGSGNSNLYSVKKRTGSKVVKEAARAEKRATKKAAEKAAKAAQSAAKTDSVTLTQNMNPAATAANEKSSAVTTDLSSKAVGSNGNAPVQLSTPALTNPNAATATVARDGTNVRVTLAIPGATGVGPGSASLTINGNKPAVSSQNSEGKITFSASQIQGAAKAASLGPPVQPAQPTPFDPPAATDKAFGASAGANKTSSGLGVGLYPEPPSNSNGLGTLPPLSGNDIKSIQSN